VVRAGDPGDEAARIGWNRLYSRYLEAIVFCRDTQDVVTAVKGSQGGHRPACPQCRPPQRIRRISRQNPLIAISPMSKTRMDHK
jgi:hypothetical protein